MDTRSRVMGITSAAVLTCTMALTPGAVLAGGTTSPASVIAWNKIADNAAITVAKLPPPVSAVYLGMAQAAVYDALVAIEGGYQPFGAPLTPQPDASIDAAVAAAAHAILVNSFPDQVADLDTAYTNAISAIPDGAAKTAGVEVGTAAAAGIITDRTGDGLNADTGFAMPAPAAGVWQLPADAKPLAPWLASYKPFTLTSADQLLPPPPPDLASAAYATEFNEVKDLGGTDSTTRTPEQATIAQFFTAPAVAQYNTGFEQVITDNGLDAMQAARLYAMGNMIGSDALTACMNAKYHYLFWRPAFAVPGAADDGNDATVADPAWTPLLKTPTHPEYPSNHACYTTAEAQVVASVLGKDDINLTLGGADANGNPLSRHYATVDDLIKEVINARIWGGLHFRGSEDVGQALGTQVVDWALAHDFQAVP